MSETTAAAIEALRKVFDSQEGSYMYTKGYLDESDFELMLATAGPIIEREVRAKVAEEIEADCRARHNRPDGDPCVDEDCNRHAAIARGRGETGGGER